MLLGCRSLGSIQRRLRARVTHPASMMVHVLDDTWMSRDKQENPCSTFFGAGCIGSVDTFPVFMQRPSNYIEQRTLYSGKYKRHCMKVQIISDFSGRPMYVSGPHLGVRADIEIWRNDGPQLGANESVLGDKAYQGDPSIHTPYKNNPGAQISQRQKDFNYTV